MIYSDVAYHASIGNPESLVLLTRDRRIGTLCVSREGVDVTCAICHISLLEGISVHTILLAIRVMWVKLCVRDEF